MALGHSGQFGAVCQVGGDLRAGVAAADHNDALSGEAELAAALDGVQLPSPEVETPRDGGEEIHSAGRSQMAAAWLTYLAGDRVEVRSVCSNPGEHVNPAP